MILSYQKNLEFFKINKSFPILKKVLILLFCGTVFFCVLHVYAMTLSTLDFARNKILMIHADGSFAEIFQYLQFLTAALLTLILFKRRKKSVYVIWSLFFLTLMINDAFRIHELGGEVVAETLNIQEALGLRAVDFGELIIAGLLGLFFIIPILKSLYSKDKEVKWISIHYIALIGVLLFFGIVVDMFHSVVHHLPRSGVLSLVEDGGEMVAASLLVWYSLYLFLKTKIPIPIPLKKQAKSF